jgi:hypothetical protein
MRLSTSLPALVLLAACSDVLPSGPADAPAAAPGAYRAELSCTVEVAQPRLTCDGDAADGAGPRRSLIIGGQHVYVRLASSGAGYNPSDSIFQVDVSVQNLMAQVFGSTDGETDSGLRVFFETGPTAVPGPGSVVVDNADGEAIFLTAPTPYFTYGGLLYTGEITETKPWRFKMDPEVDRFVFRVYVQGALPHEGSVLLFRPQHEPDGGFIAGLWGASASDVFAAGFFGTLMRYAGGAWTADESPTEENLWDVWGSSATDVFAVGEAGTIVHWNGTVWELMESGLEAVDCGCGPPGIWGVWGSGPANVWAVADDGIILHYDGVAWTAADTMPVAALYGVWGTGPSDVFAVGDDGGIFHYDGTSWTAMTSGLEGTGEYLNGVWGLSSTDVYAAASNGVLHYDGTSWSPLAGAQECEHFSVWGSAANDLFVANVCGIDHWDGSTWAYMDPEAFVTELWGTGPHNVLTNGNGGIYRGRR